MAGRPRKYDPADARAAALKASREGLAARGGKLLQVRLEPEELAALERLQAAHNLGPARDAIGFALLQAARRIRQAN